MASTCRRRSAGAFAASLHDWPPFDDAPRFLRRLRRLGVPLAILSNVTLAGLRSSVRALATPFDQLVTAEGVRSYKPAPLHWAALQSSRGIVSAQQLHVAASIVHDVRPASALGVPSVWVNRNADAPPDDVSPTLTVATLDELAELLATFRRSIDQERACDAHHSHVPGRRRRLALRGCRGGAAPD